MKNKHSINETNPVYSLDITRDRLVEMIKTYIGEQFVELLKDPEVTEIMINSDENLWVERLGKPMELCGKIKSEATMAVIKLIASSTDALCNDKFPSLSAEFALDGSRLQAMIPPLTQGPFLTLRTKLKRIITMDEYVEQGMITPKQKDKLVELIRKKKNILICGGTSSGKTTFINGLINEITRMDELSGKKQRLILIEDTYELQCTSLNHEFFRSNKNYSQDKLLKDALRSRPDRIILGEIRSEEALTFLDALNTGHDGSITSIHASCARRGLKRLEQLIQRVITHPQQETIADAIDVILFLKKDENEKRKVYEMVELVDFRNGEYILKPVL